MSRVWIATLLATAVLWLPAPSAEAQWRRDRDAAPDGHIVTVDGLTRRYQLHRPPGGSTGKPLLIVLHGTQGSGAKMERGLGFDPHADRHGFVVAYPDAYTPRGERQSWRWNDGRGTLPSSRIPIDDVRFLAALIDEIARKHGIDRRRVFLTGASNGAIMTYRAACEAPHLFAGIAPVIGNVAEPLSRGCRPRSPVSILAINGVADPFVPYLGGEVCPGVHQRVCEGGRVASAATSTALFARAASCALTPTRSSRPPQVADGTSVEDIRHGGCRDGQEVGLIAIHGGGHAWPPVPSRLGASRSGTSSGNIDATAEIVAFMQRIAPSR